MTRDDVTSNEVTWIEVPSSAPGVTLKSAMASTRPSKHTPVNGSRNGGSDGHAVRELAAGEQTYDLTVEQLAAEVGMSVRNIRNHHTRGLLPAPEVRARVGYYSAEHIARLRLILDLQADGFNLAAIERLLSGSDGLAERVPRLRRAVVTSFDAETPELVTGEELLKRFGEVEAKDAERVRKLKLLVPLGDD